MNKIASNARLKASLEEMAQLGSPVDLSVAVTEFENEKVEIEQVGGIVESHLFELEDRRVACIANIAVTNQTARTIDVVDVELRAPWDDSLFEWLTPRQVNSQGRAKRESAYSVYQFPGKYGLQLGHNRGHQSPFAGAQETSSETTAGRVALGDRRPRPRWATSRAAARYASHDYRRSLPR